VSQFFIGCGGFYVVEYVVAVKFMELLQIAVI
jgi:hypothetical protein